MLKKLKSKIVRARKEPLLKSAAYGAMTSGVNTSILLFGNGLYAYLLGAEQYGTLAIVMSFAQLMQLGNLGLGYGATKLCRETPEKTSYFLYAGMIISVIPILSIILLYKFGGASIGLFFGKINGLKAGTAALLALGALLSSLALINEFIGGILNGLGRVESANNANLISKSGGVLLGSALLCFPQFRNYAGVAVASCIVGFLATFYQLWSVSKLPSPVSIRPVWPRLAHFKALFHASGGVAFGGIASVLIFPFARLSIASIAGASQVALYDLLIKFSFAFRALFELSLRPFIREFAPAMSSYESRRSLFFRTDKWIRRIAPVFGCLVIISFAIFIELFKQRLRLAASLDVAFWCALMVSIGSTASLLNIPSYFWLIANGNNKQVLISHTLFAATHILCFILIIHVPAQYACLSFCVSFAVSALAALLVLRSGAIGSTARPVSVHASGLA